MKKLWIGCVLGVGLLTVACERKGEVQSDIEDLKEARAQTSEVAADLQQRLEEAKAEVLRLEEQLVLARQGVTDEVIEERQELKETVSGRTEEVREEVREAQKEALEHNKQVQAAQEHLKATKPVNVQAELETDTTVTPAGKAVEVDTVRREIDVERLNVSGQDKHQEGAHQEGVHQEGVQQGVQR